MAFDTESEKSNLPLIDFVEDYLREHGVAVLRAPNATGDKAALLATIGPQIDGGDRPFRPYRCRAGRRPALDQRSLCAAIADGRIYARGSCDMKGFDAVALAMIPLQASGLSRPIHILLSYDEETTCEGSLDFIRRFGKDLPRPARSSSANRP